MSFTEKGLGNATEPKIKGSTALLKQSASFSESMFTHLQ